MRFNVRWPWLFTLALFLPLVAILKSIACRGNDRLPWFGVALFGLVSLSVVFRLPVSVLNINGSMAPPDTILAECLYSLS